MAEREDGYDAACIQVLRGLENVRKRPDGHVVDTPDAPSGEGLSDDDLLDVPAVSVLVGCSRAMAEHHIERGGLASAFRDGSPLVTRASAEALKIRYAEIRAVARELSAATEAELEAEPASPSPSRP